MDQPNLYCLHPKRSPFGSGSLPIFHPAHPTYILDMSFVLDPPSRAVHQPESDSLEPLALTRPPSHLALSKPSSPPYLLHVHLVLYVPGKIVEFDRDGFYPF